MKVAGWSRVLFIPSPNWIPAARLNNLRVDVSCIHSQYRAHWRIAACWTVKAGSETSLSHFLPPVTGGRLSQETETFKWGVCRATPPILSFPFFQPIRTTSVKKTTVLIFCWWSAGGEVILLLSFWTGTRWSIIMPNCLCGRMPPKQSEVLFFWVENKFVFSLEGNPHVNFKPCQF